MPERITIILVAILIYSKGFGGCCVTLIIGKIDLPVSSGTTLWFGNTAKTFYFNQDDGIYLHPNACSGCSIDLKKIYFNDSLIPLSTKLKCNAGKYIVYLHPHTEFPSEAAISFIISNEYVGIHEYNSTSLFKVFPNPAKENVTISSTSEDIKSVKIFGAASGVIYLISVQDSEINIPLNNYPPGIYFIEVATVSKRTAIKKIVVE